MSAQQSVGKHFQVKLSGKFQDYQGNEDKMLKRAYLAGFPNAKYNLRGQSYEVRFAKEVHADGKTSYNGVQRNLNTGKTREIRPPMKWRPPSAPITAAGPTFCICVPAGSPGTTIQVPHPKQKGQFIAVNVPRNAKDGQAMLVPVPAGSPSAIPSSQITGQYVVPQALPAKAADASAKIEVEHGKTSAWTTGKKAAAVTGGALVVGGLAVSGAVLGEHIAEEGWDATMADLGETAEEAGEGAADAAEAAADWVGDAADSAGDFIMDLF